LPNRPRDIADISGRLHPNTRANPDHRSEPIHAEMEESDGRWSGHRGTIQSPSPIVLDRPCTKPDEDPKVKPALTTAFGRDSEENHSGNLHHLTRRAPALQLPGDKVGWIGSLSIVVGSVESVFCIRCRLQLHEKSDSPLSPPPHSASLLEQHTGRFTTIGSLLHTRTSSLQEEQSHDKPVPKSLLSWAEPGRNCREEGE